VVNKADRPGADRTASHLRAMLTVGARHDRAFGDRPHPKRPEVLLASGATGKGVAELLAALDRRRQARTTDPDQVDLTRLARAEAQLAGILAERVRQRIHDPVREKETRALLRAVATHELDPYSAADALLSSLSHDRA